MIDFEMSLINAVSNVYGGNQLSGCVFHLAKNFWKKWQNLHLTSRYNRDDKDGENCRLAFRSVIITKNGFDRNGNMDLS